MDLLRRNLAALAERDPALAARLHLPVRSDHVRPGAAPGLRVGRSWLPLALTPEACGALLAAARPGEALLLFGVGLGEALAPALERACPVVAWDRDPWLLRCALGAQDLTGPLREGRLCLSLNADLLARLPWSAPMADHPVLARVYRQERRLVATGVGARRALLVAGGLFVDDLDEALRERGYSVLPWEVTRHAREELTMAARAVAPEVVVAVNYSHGLAEACAELGLPLLCWEVDPATDLPRLGGPAGRAHVFTYRRANVAQYAAAGFPDVRYLPLAANPARRHAPDGAHDPRYEAPISFVGSSMVRPSLEHRAAFLAAFQEWSRAPDPAAGRAVLEGILAAQRRDPTRYVVPALLERACPGWRVAALARQQADPGQWLGELAAAEKRLNVVAALGPLGIRVWGDEGWNLCAKAGVGVAGPAGHGAELNAIYAGSRINLDVNRIYQADIATMRVFDILACGGFALVEHSEALAELFEIGVELATWRTLDDLVAQCRHYLAHPGEARRIAEAGRARVLRDHTVAQRLSTMLGEAGLEAAGQGLPKR